MVGAMLAHLDYLHGVGAARLADGLADGQHDQVADLDGTCRYKCFLGVKKHLVPIMAALRHHERKHPPLKMLTL